MFKKIFFKKKKRGEKGKKERKKRICVEGEVVSNGEVEWRDRDGKTILDLIKQDSKDVRHGPLSGRFLTVLEPVVKICLRSEQGRHNGF